MQSVITTQQELENVVATLNQSSWFTIDTEFIRERSYFSQLCLIQVATDTICVGIDPLAIDDLTPLFETLKNPNILKVFHAAHQDLEIFFNLMGEVPAPIFDTQIAAAVLGVGDQIGYARLVEAYLGKTLEKSQSRTDWSKRPLNDKQILYALDDVRYLHQIYPIMQEQLESLKRSDWLEQDFARFTDPATYTPDTAAMWKKVRGNQSLKGVQLAILKELCIWREEKAIEKDQPRKWLASDDLMLDIARMKPNNAKAIKSLRSLRGNVNPRFMDAWLTCVQKGLNTPKEDWPKHSRSRKPNTSESLLIDLLMTVLNYQANQHNISPAAIASRKSIEKMILQGDNKLSDDWRGKIVNQAFESLLSGKSTISIDQSRHMVILP